MTSTTKTAILDTRHNPIEGRMRIEPCHLDTVRTLCELYHGYASAGGVSVYCWSVVEGNDVVAAYAWQPPPPGAAVSVCPEAPAGVLSLSRMVAVPKAVRALVHVSKPLRVQMRRLIDRGRWPVLVTFSDEGQGHTGHVYIRSSRRSADSRSAPKRSREGGFTMSEPKKYTRRRRLREGRDL